MNPRPRKRAPQGLAAQAGQERILRLIQEYFDSAKTQDQAEQEFWRIQERRARMRDRLSWEGVEV